MRVDPAANAAACFLFWNMQKNKEIDVLLVYDYGRISKHYLETLDYIVKLHIFGVEVEAAISLFSVAPKMI